MAGKPAQNMPPRHEKVVITTLTPEQAQLLLRDNSKNRPLNQSRVKRYADIIRAGRWRLNGETIKQDTKNRLLDGQHRLHACIQANKPITVILVTGLEPDVFDTIDQGTGRTGSDIFYLCGVRNPAVVSSAIGFVWQARKGYTICASASSAKPEMDERVALFDELPTFEERVAEVVRHKALLPDFAPGMLAAHYYLFFEKSMQAARTFLGVLVNGVESPLHPVVRLRDKALALRAEHYRISSELKAALVRDTWNKFVAGVECHEPIELPSTLDIPINGVTSLRWLKGEGS